jgi:hypothetical protein
MSRMMVWKRRGSVKDRAASPSCTSTASLRVPRPKPIGPGRRSRGPEGCFGSRKRKRRPAPVVRSPVRRTATAGLPHVGLHSGWSSPPEPAHRAGVWARCANLQLMADRSAIEWTETTLEPGDRVRQGLAGLRALLRADIRGAIPRRTRPPVRAGIRVLAPAVPNWRFSREAAAHGWMRPPAAPRPGQEPAGRAGGRPLCMEAALGAGLRPLAQPGESRSRFVPPVVSIPHAYLVVGS